MTKKILCPVDFSTGSMRALDKACELAQALGAELEVVHAYQVPILGLPEAEAMLTPAMTAELTAKAERSLEAFKQAITRPGVSVTTKLVEGYPAEAIAERARELGAEMVVMGTHGRTGFRRFLLGSVAERVVRLSTVPVLTVHTDDE